MLDPIFSLRRRVRARARRHGHAIFSTVVAESREEVLDLADKYRDPATFERAAILAWTQAQVQLHHLGIDSDEAHLFQRLANRIIYSRPVAAAAGERARCATTRARRRCGRTASPATCRSCVVRIDEADDIDIVRQLLRAHEYWRMKLLAVDLVIINEQGATYAQDLQARSRRWCAPASRRSATRRTRATAACTSCAAISCAEPDRVLLLVGGARGAAEPARHAWPSRWSRLERPDEPHPPRAGAAARRAVEATQAGRPRPELEFFNGLGGFADGRTRVRDHPRARAVDAGAVDERHRQPARSASRSRSRAPATRGRATAARTS